MIKIPKESPSAVKKVKDPLPKITVCYHCSGKVILTSNSFIYGKEYGPWPYCYACTVCDAYVGVHMNTHIPLGTLANREIREARKINKQKFIDMYKKKRMNKNQAYTWLAKQLQIPKSKCHWGWFGVEMCNKAGQICDMEIKNE